MSNLPQDPFHQFDQVVKAEHERLKRLYGDTSPTVSQVENSIFINALGDVLELFTDFSQKYGNEAAVELISTLCKLLPGLERSYKKKGSHAHD